MNGGRRSWACVLCACVCVFCVCAWQWVSVGCRHQHPPRLFATTHGRPEPWSHHASGMHSNHYWCWQQKKRKKTVLDTMCRWSLHRGMNAAATSRRCLTLPAEFRPACTPWIPPPQIKSRCEQRWSHHPAMPRLLPSKLELVRVRVCLFRSASCGWGGVRSHHTWDGTRPQRTNPRLLPVCV